MRESFDSRSFSEGVSLISAFLVACALGSSVISGVVGMAGGIVLLSAMTFVMPIRLIIPIHGCVQLVSNFSRTWMLRGHVRKNIFLSFIVGLPFGAVASVLVIKQIKDPRVFLALIAAVIFWALFKPKKFSALKIPIWAFSVVGALTGFLALLVGATGPFIAAFFLRDDLSKEEIVATKASVQFASHLLKIPAFLTLGFDYSEHFVVIAAMSVAVIVGTKLGVGLLKGITPKAFTIIFKTALFLSALRLVYKIVE